MTIRMVKGLKWARPTTRPGCILIGRPRGAKRAGVKYERDLAIAMPHLVHGQWFEFEDLNGHGYCQVDFLWHYGDESVGILESKYTWTEDGHRQIERLYRPVLEGAGWRNIWGIVVCKKLIPNMGSVHSTDVEIAITRAKEGKRSTWCWIGGFVPQPRFGAFGPNHDRALAGPKALA